MNSRLEGGWTSERGVFKPADRQWLVDQVGESTTTRIEGALRVRAAAHDPEANNSTAPDSRAYEAIAEGARNLLAALDAAPASFAYPTEDTIRPALKVIAQRASNQALVLKPSSGRPPNTALIMATSGALAEWEQAGKEVSTYQDGGASRLVTMVLSALGSTADPRTYLDHYSERNPAS